MSLPQSTLGDSETKREIAGNSVCMPCHSVAFRIYATQLSSRLNSEHHVGSHNHIRLLARARNTDPLQKFTAFCAQAVDQSGR